MSLPCNCLSLAGMCTWRHRNDWGSPGCGRSTEVLCAPGRKCRVALEVSVCSYFLLGWRQECNTNRNRKNALALWGNRALGRERVRLRSGMGGWGGRLPLLTTQHNLLNTLKGHTWSNLPQACGMRGHAPRVQRLLAGPSLVPHSKFAGASKKST